MFFKNSLDNITDNLTFLLVQAISVFGWVDYIVAIIVIIASKYHKVLVILANSDLFSLFLSYMFHETMNFKKVLAWTRVFVNRKNTIFQKYLQKSTKKNVKSTIFAFFY